MTQRLFGHAYRIGVGTLETTSLDFEASIVRDDTRKPNKATLKLFNLPDRYVAEIREGADVRIDAGWASAGGAARRFAGSIKSIDVMQDDVSSVATLECKDSADAYRRSRINRGFAPGTTVEAVIREIVAALDVGAGNLDDAVTGITLERGGNVFTGGYTAAGQAHRELTQVLRACGLRWSVQDGVLQLRRRGQPVRTSSLLLTPDTGLVGSPSRGEKDTVRAKALIQPGLYPGAVVRLKTEQIQGDFALKNVTDTLNSRTSDWFSQLVMKRF